MTKQEEIQSRLSEKISKEELSKGFQNWIMWGREGYRMDETGRLVAMTEEETRELVDSGKPFTLVFDEEYANTEKEWGKYVEEMLYGRN